MNTSNDTKKMMAAVLGKFATCGVIGEALSFTGVSRRTFTEWLTDFPEFKEKYEDVKERFVDGLELVAIERAKEKSDTLLLHMLKAHRGQIYNIGQDHNIKTDKPVTLIFPEGILNEEERRMLSGEDTDGEA
jgi:hypothetical protein